jgi:hypothetical protein
MTKQKILNATVNSVDGVTIGELETIATSQIKDTDLLAVETDLTTNSISISQVKEVVSNELLSYTNNKLGSIIFHPAPAGYQDIPAETNGFGDAILVADGRLLDKADYPDMWNFIKTRKDKNIYGFNGETLESFKIDDLTNKITLPNLLSGKAVYMGNYGVQDAIFPQHTFTSGNITPTTKPHNHAYLKWEIKSNTAGLAYGSGGKEYFSNPSTENSTVEINPFTVSSTSITNLPAGVTVGTDYKIAGVKMIPCIVCKPTYEINAGGGGSGGGGVATEDLDMNLFKIINLGVPVADSDAVRLVDLKVDNNKIIYKKNLTGGYDSLQATLDTMWSVLDISVSKVTGKMDSSYDITKITQPNNIITLEYLEYSNNISGYIKNDRTVELTGTGTFNTKQPTSMDDLITDNIIYSDSIIADETKAKAIRTLKDKLTEMDAVIQSQANLITQLQEKTDTVRAFPRRFLKTTGLPTNLTIGGNQAKRILDEVTIQNVIGYDSSTFTLTGTTNKIIKELITPPFTTKLLNIRISLSHTVSMGNTQIQATLWRVRNDDITTPSIVAGGTVIYNDDPDARIVTTMINSIVVNGDSDPFVKYGYYIELKNLEPTALTYSTIDILITATCDRGLTE